MKLAEKIQDRGNRWIGPVTTLNYDILLQRAFKQHHLEVQNILAVHGSCNKLADFREAISGDLSRLKYFNATIRNVRSEAVYDQEKFNSLISQDYVPEIAYYDRDKRSDINNQNLLLYRDCFNNLVRDALKIIIVGVSLIEHDYHIWEPLANTKARILYINPSYKENTKFQEWAKKNELKYSIYKLTFAGAFNLICQNLGLESN